MRLELAYLRSKYLGRNQLCCGYRGFFDGLPSYQRVVGHESMAGVVPNSASNGLFKGARP
jgi:hypothetical protein